MFNDLQLFMFGGILLTTLFLIPLGLYFLFKPKRKGDISTEEYINRLNLSPEAKAIRIKEANKLTAKKFTKAWFLEYWRGQRSPWNAWFTWVFIGRILTAILFAVPFAMVDPSVKMNDPLLNLPVFIFWLAFLIYSLVAAIILWRCAKNGTYMYLVRALAVYSVARLFI